MVQQCRWGRRWRNQPWGRIWHLWGMWEPELIGSNIIFQKVRVKKQQCLSLHRQCWTPMPDFHEKGHFWHWHSVASSPCHRPPPQWRLKEEGRNKLCFAKGLELPKRPTKSQLCNEGKERIPAHGHSEVSAKISGRRAKGYYDAFIQTLSGLNQNCWWGHWCGVDSEHWNIAPKPSLHMHNIHKCCWFQILAHTEFLWVLFIQRSWRALQKERAINKTDGKVRSREELLKGNTLFL